MSRLRHAPGVDSRDVDGEVVVWDGTSLHLLDPAASAVWRLVDGGRTQAEVVAELALQFAADPDRLGADVETLVGSLIARGLVVRDEAGATLG